MDSPGTDTSRITAARSLVIDSIKGCAISGFRIPKEDLRRKITMPQYLRLAIRDAIQSEDVAAGNHHYAATVASGEKSHLPESPLIVFINSKSGGRHGPELKWRLQDLMGEEQIVQEDPIHQPEKSRVDSRPHNLATTVGDPSDFSSSNPYLKISPESTMVVTEIDPATLPVFPPTPPADLRDRAYVERLEALSRSEIFRPPSRICELFERG